MKFLKQINLWACRLTLGAVCTLTLCACSENNGEEDEYANWKQRNESYFAKAMSTASDSIAMAKRIYGTQWEEYSNTRQYLSYSRDNGELPKQTDSICVQILKRGTGTKSPFTTDSIRMAYRTILMPTDQHPTGLIVDHSGFSSEYSKVFDSATMAPSTFKVNSLVKGVATALLYMHTGDRWRVTMPADLAYGTSSSGDIPKNSTVIFEMELVGIYPMGTVPPHWQ